ncbi:hypothetical protein CERSUDRAFT_123436 [Gelatoporia subvermispora B]|uniref:BRCT domain-containing protein n=1 Tax=Ceriporiopsis subvermispora (strain B) TaxID=914234 RepID=M2RGB6_CERS8|nr:hypothetical protein CERSUDRAFT_123436 [Gelatoporia subvermispora B]
MAPARTTNRRAQRDQHNAQPSSSQANVSDNVAGDDLFLEPMMGTPLAIFVEKDVENRDTIVELISKHGGIVSTGYSTVAFILVDPHKESGQSLYRLYAGKKNKMVLNANWVLECVKAGTLQTYHNNYAGCKVTGTEKVTPVAPNPPPIPQPQAGPSSHILPDDLARQMQAGSAALMQAHPAHNHMQQAMATAAPETLVHHTNHGFPYPVYTTPMDTRSMHPATAAPPQTWQAANGIAPQQTHMAAPPPAQQQHMMQRHPDPYREDPGWAGTFHQPSPQPMVTGAPQEYDYRYRDDQSQWVGSTNDYYGQTYDQSYAEPTAYMEEAGPSNAETSTSDAGTAEKTRGRKRTRAQPAPPASSLVVNRRNPPARSPTPPTRVIKSTYGGNLFTADDVLYLKKYIDFCQEQGLVLSLREICERIAVKAPHHTFYSWRRYCNKHQIRLGGYAMDVREGSDSPVHDLDQGPVHTAPHASLPVHAQGESEGHTAPASAGPGAMAAARRVAAADTSNNRARSPTPPRALFRSTTGKGVAFTDEDVIFLVRFLEYRTRIHGGKVDMVAFWKDVAAKAPHHSRASWMKFWRRHRHELEHTDGDEPLPAPPEKKMRYSRADDILLAKFFLNKPEGTSDRIFQDFGRMHPHHPWKGWQEHHRIHKAKIDHIMQKLANGEPVEEGPEEPEFRHVL